MRPARSCLFVPGNRPERFDKALASGADAVIVDLEDAVAPQHKAAARDAVVAWLSPKRPVVLRINAINTPWFAEDLALCRHPGVAAVMLAKTESAEDLAPLAGVAVIPLIESAAGFDRLREIAAAPRVQRLAFGAIDFQLDLGLHAHYEELLFFRSQLVLASRLAGLAAPLDSPSTAIEDTGAVQTEAQAARRLGFGGKLCIHPRQLEVVNAAFSATAEEVAWAQGVLAAAARSEGAAVSLNGQMIDKPVILRAQAILAQRG